MRREMRWRYYCDFCKKSGASGAALKKHEAHCTLNPARTCRLCDLLQAVTPPMTELIAALVSGGTAAIVTLMDVECPACILAAIRQHKATLALRPAAFDPYIPADDYPGSDYDYAASVKNVMAEVRETMNEGIGR